MIKRGCLVLTLMLLTVSLIACSNTVNDTDDQQEINTILVVGDSLTTGYNIATPWPSLLNVDDGVNVINFSKNGEMTSWGLFHLPGLLIEHKPDVVLIMLGTNDSARGSLEQAIANIKSMISQSKVAGATVYVATLPPITRKGAANLLANQRSKELSNKIAALSAANVVDVRAAFAEPKSLLADGVHPTQAGSQVIADQISEHLKKYRND